MHSPIPVLVGVAQILQRIDDLEEAREPLELMIEAVHDAARDAGSKALLERAGSVRVVRGLWRYGDPARVIAERIGAPTTLIGHSNGGRIALYMASEPSPSPWIERLVLVSPSGITPRRTWKYHVKKNLTRTLKVPFEILPDPLREFGLDWLRHPLVA